MDVAYNVVCCSVWQCVAVYGSVLPCDALWCSGAHTMPERVANGAGAYSSVVQCVAICCSVLQRVLQCVALLCSVLQRGAVCCSIVHCVAACCSTRSAVSIKL